MVYKVYEVYEVHLEVLVYDHEELPPPRLLLPLVRLPARPPEGLSYSCCTIHHYMVVSTFPKPGSGMATVY